MIRKTIGTIIGILLLAIIPLVASADSTIVGGIGQRHTYRNGAVWISRTTGYVFSAPDVTALFYVKTTDGGASWAAPIRIDNYSSVPGGYHINSFAVWYDGWTTFGLSDPDIHIVWKIFTTSSPQAHVQYNRLNTSNDTFARNCATFANCNIASFNYDNTAAICIGNQRCITIVKSGPDHFIKLAINTLNGDYFRSTDNGTNWASRGNSNLGTAGAPYLLGPSGFNDVTFTVGGDSGGFRIFKHDDITNTWAQVGSTITPAINPAYDTKNWAIAMAANSVYVGFANGTTFRIFEITSASGVTFVVTEKAAVTGYSSATDIELSYDQTNGRLYAIYGNKYQRSNASVLNAGSTFGWEAVQSITTTSVVNVRIAPLLGTATNRLMPIFYVNPNWVRNLNTLILASLSEPEDIDNWLIHFIDSFTLSDSNGRTIAAGGLLVVIILGLFLMDVWYLVIGSVAVFFAAGLSQVRIMDGSRLLEPWIILVALILGGMAIILKIIALQKAGSSDGE